MGFGLVLTAMCIYWPSLKTNLELSDGAAATIFSVTTVFVILAVLGGYSFFRYAYFAMGFIVLVLFLAKFFGLELNRFQPEGNNGSYLKIATLFAFAFMPSMVLAWRERDI